MIELQAIEYGIGEQTFTGWLADGSRGKRTAGVLVAHEGPGLTEHEKRRAQMLAELGYVAFAMDLYGEQNPTLERAKELVRSLRTDRATLRQRASAALDLLVALHVVDAGRVGAIGFCFGGMAVLELARSGAPVLAVVGFHADLTSPTPADAAAIRGKIMVCLGADDPIVNAAQRGAFVDEMTAARVDWQMVLYGGAGHSFTNRDIDAYGFPGFAWQAEADRRSWQAMRTFFDDALGPIAW